MARRSSITQLDPRVRELVDRLVREGRATIDQIVAELEARLGEQAPSRSSVGRYAANARRQMDRYREAQEVAKVWVGKLEEEPDGDVGRLLAEMLRTVAFSAIGELGEGEAGATPEDVMLLARAIKDLAAADKTRADAVLRVRKEMAQEAASKAEKIARKSGLSPEAVGEIRREILGIAT